MRLKPPQALTARTPFTVLGGFLGAGKTTLVNHLLKNARGRYAVLVNDFGAVNVDAVLIAAHDGETLRLANGCICCSLGDDFAASIAALLDDGISFDHIFVEASGVADPQAIADIARIEPQLSLNAIVVVADAERIATQLVDPRIGDTVARQIAAADLLALNKCDLVDAGVRAAAALALRKAKPDLRIVDTIASAIPLDLIDGADAPVMPPRFRAEGGSHEAEFRRMFYRRAAIFDDMRLRNALNALPPDLLRLKGFCRMSNGAAPHLLQWVGGRWSLDSFDATADRAIELVGIGTTSLEPTAVEQCLDAALVR